MFGNVFQGLKYREMMILSIVLAAASLLFLVLKLGGDGLAARDGASHFKLQEESNGFSSEFLTRDPR